MPQTKEKLTEENSSLEEWAKAVVSVRANITGHTMKLRRAKVAYREYYENGLTPQEAIDQEWKYRDEKPTP